MGLLKRKLTDEEKVKSIYSGELVIIAVVMIVFATLELTGVFNPIKRRIFLHILTLTGSTIILGDIIWALVSKKRRAKVSLIDKITLIPMPIYVISFNVISFVTNPDGRYYQVGLAILFLYLASVYLFQAIYHFKYPVPGLLDALKEDEKPEVKEEPKEEIKEENTSTKTE